MIWLCLLVALGGVGLALFAVVSWGLGLVAPWQPLTFKKGGIVPADYQHIRERINHGR